MKRTLIASALAALFTLGTALGAAADPDFGTGNSSKKHNDAGAVCWPGGNPKDADLPQCKP